MVHHSITMLWKEGTIQLTKRVLRYVVNGLTRVSKAREFPIYRVQPEHFTRSCSSAGFRVEAVERIEMGLDSQMIFRCPRIEISY
jgi:hypothetical protein